MSPKKDFCHVTIEKETDCTIPSSLILIPANTVLQILESVIFEKKKSVANMRLKNVFSV